MSRRVDALSSSRTGGNALASDPTVGPSAEAEATRGITREDEEEGSVQAVARDDDAAWQATVATVEAEFHGQAVDANWAPEVEGAVKNMFAGGAMASAELVSAECRTTICRIRFRGGYDSGWTSFMGAFRHAWPFGDTDGLMRALDEPDAFVLYLSRNGNVLP